MIGSGFDAGMMRPVHRLTRFMATLDAMQLTDLFVAEPIIIENFKPYVFRGRNGLSVWQEGFRKHAADGSLSELQARFGAPQDFSASGNTVYFVLPTAWTGKSAGRPFEEEGGWAFVLVRRVSEWRVKSYAWAVTAYRFSRNAD
jgi:hypothetical protein